MKKFEITKEQIIELINCLNQIKVDYRLKQWFPQAFESELETGKWYKMPKYGDAIFCITKIQNSICFAYGINYMGEWRDEKDFTTTDSPEEFILATDKEIETALIAEANRREFKEGVKIKPINKVTHLNNKIDLGYNTCFYESENEFWMGGYCLFKDGKWAEIISEPIELTLEQIAEKFNVNVEQLKIKK